MKKKNRKNANPLPPPSPDPLAEARISFASYLAAEVQKEPIPFVEVEPMRRGFLAGWTAARRSLPAGWRLVEDKKGGGYFGPPGVVLPGDEPRKKFLPNRRRRSSRFDE